MLQSEALPQPIDGDWCGLRGRRLTPNVAVRVAERRDWCDRGGGAKPAHDRSLGGHAEPDLTNFRQYAHAGRDGAIRCST